MDYDVIIVGAGPAGIFTALELLRCGSKASILLIEKGKPVEKRHCPKAELGRCVNCKPSCAITTGFSGAGAFSDGKLSLSCEIGGELPQLIGDGLAQDLIDYNVDSMTSYYENMASMYGMEFEDFLNAAMGMTKKDYDEKLPEVIKEGLLQEFCIKGIAETEGIEISDEEFEEGCKENMESYGYTDKEEFLNAIGGESVLRLNLIQEKVYDFLMENSEIEETQE